MSLRLFFAIGPPVRILLQSISPILRLRHIPDYLQAQGIVYLDAPQQLTSSVVNTTLQEGSSSQGGPVPDGQKLEAKIGDKVKEEFEMLEVDVDDDEEIKTLLVRNFCHSYPSIRVER